MALGAKEDSLVMLSLDIQCYELILYYHAYLKGSMAVKIYIYHYIVHLLNNFVGTYIVQFQFL